MLDLSLEIFAGQSFNPDKKTSANTETSMRICVLKFSWKLKAESSSQRSLSRWSQSCWPGCTCPNCCSSPRSLVSRASLGTNQVTWKWWWGLEFHIKRQQEKYWIFLVIMVIVIVLFLLHLLHLIILVLIRICICIGIVDIMISQL